LALADILTTGEPVHHDHAEELIAELGAGDLPDAAMALSDEEAWLQRFAATLLPLDPNPAIGRRPIAEWLALATRLSAFDEFRETADKVLRHHGIAIVRPKSKTEPVTEFWLALRHPLLERIHAGSKWKAEDGVGRWCAAAQKLGACGAMYRLSGPPAWGTKVSLNLIIDEAVAKAVIDEVKRQTSFANEFDGNES
jgi:hypothetical protein